MAINDVLFGKKDKLNVFGAPSQGEWNLSKGVYTTKKTGRAVTFFYENSKGEDPLQKTAIDQISDKGGRRLAKYEYPYSNGQGLADLGRKAESMTFNIKFHGLNYQQKFKEFLDVVTNNNEQGTLLHPIRGPLTVRFEEYEFVHRYDEWNSITIKAVFQEDNTDQILSTNLPLTSQDSALRSAVQELDHHAKHSFGDSKQLAAAKTADQRSGVWASRTACRFLFIKLSDSKALIAIGWLVRWVHWLIFGNSSCSRFGCWRSG
jgi:hypothetical protein